MKDEYKKLLLERYPTVIYEQTILDVKDGWFNLINLLCDNISTHCTIENKHCEILKINKVDARSHIEHSSTDDYIKGVISLGEVLMDNSCEKCGSPGKPINVRGTSLIACHKCEDRFFVPIL